MVKKKRGKSKETLKIVSIILGIIFTLIFTAIIGLILISSSIDTSSSEAEASSLEIEVLTAEETLDAYLNTLDYSDRYENVYMLKEKIKYSAGIRLDYSKADQKDNDEVISFYEDLANFCKLNGEYEKILCGSLDSIRESAIEQSQETSVLSSKVLYNDSQTYKIEVKLLQNYTASANSTITESTNIYIINKTENGWKIIDFINESGEGLSLNELKDAIKQNEESMAGLISYLDTIKNNVEIRKRYQRQLNSAVNIALPEEEIIEVDASSYQGNQEEHLVTITYYFDDAWLLDNYLEVLSDSADIFENIFPVNIRIKNVEIYVKERYNDDFGVPQERFLAKTSMSRDTYSKISWVGFESSNLDKITSVNYYGDSFYKSLKDIGSGNTGRQMVPTGQGDYIDACEIVREACQGEGDCYDYEQMQAMGIC